MTSNLTLETEQATKEGSILTIETNVIYKINENSLRDIYLKYRPDYEKIFIKPMIESELRNIVSAYEVKYLYNELTRNKIKKYKKKVQMY